MSIANLSEYLAHTLGLKAVSQIHWNLSAPALFETSIRNREARVGTGGALVVNTGTFTGRAPNDKFIVKDEETRDTVWWGEVNRSISSEHFERLLIDMAAFLKDIPGPCPW